MGEKERKVVYMATDGKGFYKVDYSDGTLMICEKAEDGNGAPSWAYINLPIRGDN